MTLNDIGYYRLQLQQISNPQFAKAVDAVKWLGAVQAQDYLAALWAIGLRTKNSTEANVEKALADKSIVRTWPLRGTLHFVAAKDVRWMLETFTPRIIAMNANRLKRESDLDERVFTKSKKIFERKLSGGNQLTREELYDALESSRISTSGQRGLHILWRLAQDGFICFGPRLGKQYTFVLLDEWVPATKKITRDEALGKLAQRYFASHGPATIQDFAWWSGLTNADAKKATEIIKLKLSNEHIGDQHYLIPHDLPKLKKTPSNIYLLPSYDEYLISYTERSVSLSKEHQGKTINTVNGIFFPIIVIQGKVAGTWKRVFKKESVSVETKVFGSVSTTQTNSILKTSKKYAKFLGTKLS